MPTEYEPVPTSFTAPYQAAPSVPLGTCVQFRPALLGPCSCFDASADIFDRDEYPLALHHFVSRQEAAHMLGLANEHFAALRVRFRNAFGLALLPMPIGAILFIVGMILLSTNTTVGDTLPPTFYLTMIGFALFFVSFFLVLAAGIYLGCMNRSVMAQVQDAFRGENAATYMQRGVQWRVVQEVIGWGRRRTTLPVIVVDINPSAASGGPSTADHYPTKHVS